MRWKLGFLALALSMLIVLTGAAPAEAADQPKGYVVFGEDLTNEQLDTVLDIFDIDKLSNYTVSYTTNQEEHEAFDAYLSSSVIGTKAVSSILLKESLNEGIHIRRENISFCTDEMYLNALVSAGVKNVDVVIAAPFPVSGTCALVSAMNAYEMMTGEKLDKQSVDTALDELVTTGEVGDALGDNDLAAELIAQLKEQIAEETGELEEEELNRIIDETAEEMGISLDDEIKKELLALLKKFQKIDLNADSLKKQAGDLYQRLEKLFEDHDIAIPEVDPKSGMSFLEKLFEKIRQLLNR